MIPSDGAGTLGAQSTGVGFPEKKRSGDGRRHRKVFEIPPKNHAYFARNSLGLPIPGGFSPDDKFRASEKGLHIRPATDTRVHSKRVNISAYRIVNSLKEKPIGLSIHTKSGIARQHLSSRIMRKSRRTIHQSTFYTRRNDLHSRQSLRPSRV